jgi:hypothetical protein
LGDAIWVYVFAVVLTLVFVLLTATAALLRPLGLGLPLLTAVVVIWSRLLPGVPRCPAHWRQHSPPPDSARHASKPRATGASCGERSGTHG